VLLFSLHLVPVNKFVYILYERLITEIKCSHDKNQMPMQTNLFGMIFECVSETTTSIFITFPYRMHKQEVKPIPMTMTWEKKLSHIYSSSPSLLTSYATHLSGASCISTWYNHINMINCCTGYGAHLSSLNYNWTCNLSWSFFYINFSFHKHY
jgi:hypothetical protein